MLKSYLLTGLRAIARNLTPSLINLVGLAVALGCATTIFILEDSFYSLDAMHDKGERIFEVISSLREGDETRKWATSPFPLAESMSEHAAVESFARARRYSGTVRTGETVFREGLLFVDRDFMNIFSFRVTAGSREALSEPSNIMISEAKAVTYFGNRNPVGQALSIRFGDEKRDFVVSAVLEDTPFNSSMYFNFLLPMSVWESLNPERARDWSRMTVNTFVLLREGAHPGQLETVLENYRTTQNAANPQWPVASAEFMPLRQIAVRSWDISESLSWSNHPSAMVALAVVAIFLILLACFNYMNVAVASVSTRLKEIGIRKVIGGSKLEIIRQFLTENLILCSLSLMAGTFLAYSFLVPGFNSLYEVKIGFAFSSWLTILWFFAGMLTLVAGLSGAYPAIYVSSFSAVSVLKGKEKFGSKSYFSRFLLGTQFILAFTAVVACQVFIWSSYYFENRDWGYNQQQTVVVPVQSHDQYQRMVDQVSGHPHVVSYAGAHQHVGKSSAPAVAEAGTQQLNVKHFPVGFRYLESLNIRLKEGRDFDESIESDRRESAIVNEAFVRTMGWTTAVGQSFTKDSVKYYVIGVTEDFFYDDFYTEVEPAIVTVVREDRFNFLVVKAEAGHTVEVGRFMENAWRTAAPDDPYNGFLQSEVFDSFIRANRSNNILLYFVSGVAILLAGMGLYGLVSYNLTRRLKEFSVRKVFGANNVRLFRLMNRDYLWILVLAFFVGAPLGAYLMNMLIKSIYPEQIPQTGWPYVVAIAAMLTITLVTIGSQLRRVVQENPTVTLRNE